MHYYCFDVHEDLHVNCEIVTTVLGVQAFQLGQYGHKRKMYKIHNISFCTFTLNGDQPNALLRMYYLVLLITAHGAGVQDILNIFFFFQGINTYKHIANMFIFDHLSCLGN